MSLFSKFKHKDKHSTSPLIAAHNTPSSPISSGNTAFAPQAQAPLAADRDEQPQQLPKQRLPSVVAAQRTPSFPWSSHTLPTPHPFPRYGHASPATSGPNGEVYIFGGLVRSKPRNDLWVLKPHPSDPKLGWDVRIVQTFGEPPGRRVGHAAALVGNAFIVFGGDTKVTLDGAEDEVDLTPHDADLHLLNTTTRTWSKAHLSPASARPAGRYGHTLSLLGSRLYVFGGQVDGYFFNDLVSFDLNELNTPKSRWELAPTAPGTAIPPARTNHSSVVHNDKLYIAGGTDGSVWYNDTWVYDPRTTEWTQVTTTGYLPTPREGHSTTVVAGVAYTFGGRGQDGADVPGLAALQLEGPMRGRWYAFRDMGEEPKGRSGHSLTAVGSLVAVLGGERGVLDGSGDAETAWEAERLYVLDTGKIKYPAPPSDGQRSGSLGLAQGRQMSAGVGASSPTMKYQEGSAASPSGGPRLSRLPQPRSSSRTGIPQPGYRSPPTAHQQQPTNRKVSAPVVGNPSIQTMKPMTMSLAAQGRKLSLDSLREAEGATLSPTGEHFRMNMNEREWIGRAASFGENAMENGHPSTQSPGPLSPVVGAAPARAPSSQAQPRTHSRLAQMQNGVQKERRDRTASEPGSVVNNRPATGGNEQEFVELKRRNAWLTVEVQAVRAEQKVPAELEQSVTRSLLALREELMHAQKVAEAEKALTARKIMDAERAKEIALSEAAYARAAREAVLNNDQEGFNRIEAERAAEMGKKLAAAFKEQRAAEEKLERVSDELKSEKEARNAVENSWESTKEVVERGEESYNRLKTESESWRQRCITAEQEAHTEVSRRIDAESERDRLRLEADSISKRAEEATNRAAEQEAAIAAINTAILTITNRAEEAERAVEEESRSKSELRMEFTRLKAELEEAKAESERGTTEAENLRKSLEAARAEADALRAGALQSLSRSMSRSREDRGSAASESVSVGMHQALQRQLDETKISHENVRLMADKASQELVAALERVSALESQHIRAGSDSVVTKSRLSQALKELQTLKMEHADLNSTFAESQRELQALKAKNQAMGEIITERPSASGHDRTNSFDKRRSRGQTPTSPRPDASSTDHSERMRELEAKLEESLRFQRELEAQAAAASRHRRTESNFSNVSNMEMEERLARAQTRATEAEAELAESTQSYRERLSQLESDYQSAVHYVKGTEKMLRRMKDELAKYKQANTRLQNEVEHLKERSAIGVVRDEQSQRVEAELAALRDDHSVQMQALRVAHSSEVEGVTRQLESLREQLASLREERDALHERLGRAADSGNDSATTQELHEARAVIANLQSENTALDARASEAEDKIALLLDRMEHSIDTYRQSVVSTQTLDAATVDRDSYKDRTSGMLNSLASELDQLRAHWEETTGTGPKKDRGSIGTAMSSRFSRATLKSLD
ncbi:Negative regulator of mitotic exit [Saitoella coloradoensis]